MLVPVVSTLTFALLLLRLQGSTPIEQDGRILSGESAIPSAASSVGKFGFVVGLASLTWTVLSTLISKDERIEIIQISCLILFLAKFQSQNPSSPL